MSYIIHFNPNHDPKNGQFTFSSKYSADLIREKAANKDYDADLQLKMRVDFNKAYQQRGPGENVKRFNKQNKAIEKAANTLAREEYNRKKKENPSLNVDDYCDMAWAWIDRLDEMSGLNFLERDVAHLMDLGYNRKDSEDIANWMHSTLVWDYIWDEKTSTFIDPKSAQTEKGSSK